jgi:hypothetical protein
VVVPMVGNVPLQPPEAAQVLALVALHCSVTDAPTATVVSLAFRLTSGGAATAGGVAVPDAGVFVAVLLVELLPDVSAFELAPHAASALSTVNANRDFNANANPEWRLRRIELITRLPNILRQLFPRSLNPFFRNL